MSKCLHSIDEVCANCDGVTAARNELSSDKTRSEITLPQSTGVSTQGEQVRAAMQSPDKNSEAIAWHERERVAFEDWWHSRGDHKFTETRHMAAGAAWFARASMPSATPRAQAGPLKLDTEREVFFYEQDHYYLSNFSAFRVLWKNVLFDTAEHVYHTEKFAGQILHQHRIHTAPSAHDAFKYAEQHRAERRPDWDAVKVDIMRDIIRAKARQHEYVRRKLLQTGDRVLIENSWRDPFWGWGPNRDGTNMLGRLWMELRDELRNATEGGKAGG